MILQQGIHDKIAMADYIADPCVEPSLSTGVAQALMERSPLHAWRQHPRFNNQVDDSNPRADLGSAVHSAILGGAEIAYIEADDWRTKAAKESRDAARASGKIPMLAHQQHQVGEILANGCRALNAFGPGKSEQTLIYKAGGVWHRGRPDFITDNGDADVDVKTCANADPDTWIRSTLIQGGYDIQAAIRVMGYEELGGRTRDFYFLLVEIEPPYATSIVGVGPALMDLGRRKVEQARRIWAECIQIDNWPGYDQRVHWAEPPSWAEYRFEESSVTKEVA